MAQSHFDRFMLRLEQSAGVSSQMELAQLLRLNRSAISRAKKRGRVPRAWIPRICQEMGLDPAQLTGETEEERFHTVPLVRARLDAGGGSYVVGSQVQERIAFRYSWLRRKGSPEQMVLMDVSGDSMEPLIREGDTVLIDQSRQDIHSGAVYALGVQDTIMIKRVERRPESLTLISANSSYTPIHLQGDEMETVRIIGKVVGMWRDFY